MQLRHFSIETNRKTQPLKTRNSLTGAEELAQLPKFLVWLP